MKTPTSSHLETFISNEDQELNAIKSLCYFCGRRRHSRTECPARNALCHQCGKKGHFQTVCKSSKTTANKADSKISLTSVITPCTLSSTHFSGLTQSTAQVNVNGLLLQALIDTGSCESYISEAIVKRNKWPVRPSTNRIFMATTHLSEKTLGHTFADVQYKGEHYKKVKLSLLAGLCSDVILGVDFISLHKELTIPYGGKRNPLYICGLKAARVETPSLFSNLTSDCRPVATKSRKHSIGDNKFIESEVRNLLSDKIIEPSKSPWRAQVLVTTNERHKRRMVIDYSQTINRFTLLDAYPMPRVDELVERISNYSVFSTLDLKSAYHQIPIKTEERPFTAFKACGKLYQFCRIPFGVTNGVACFQRTINLIIENEKLQDTFAYVDNVTVCGHDQESHDENMQRFLDASRKYGITFNEDKSTIATDKVCLLGYEISKGLLKPDPERFQALRNLPPPHDMRSQKRIVGMLAYYSQWIPNFSNKINVLANNTSFPLSETVKTALNELKQELEKAAIFTIDYTRPLTVETDASDVAIAATLNQDGRPVAFFSRTLSKSERRHSAIEKEAYAIVESLRKWHHYLVGNRFTLVTDQRSVAFMYDKQSKGKIKNEKIQRWRLELSCFHYDVLYRPGKHNVAADTFSRNGCVSAMSRNELKLLHDSLCHPGVTRLWHLVRAKNLPFSCEDVRLVVNQCRICAEVKPRYFSNSNGTLIKAMQPFQRLSMDFKGPLPSTSRNTYLLTIVDEFSRFPFAYACSDMSASTVIRCLDNLFGLFGMPDYVHSDRGTSFMSREVQEFLHERGVATSRTTPYNPRGNSQVERLNGSLWKAITLALKTQGLPVSKWEQVLNQALHSLRSLLCTATNETPHERIFKFYRRSTFGKSLPTWLAQPGKVLLKKGVRASKYDDGTIAVDLITCNPQYAIVRLPDGREETVSLRHLAPVPREGESEVYQHMEHEDFEPETNPITQMQVPTDHVTIEPMAAPNTYVQQGENGHQEEVNAGAESPVREPPMSPTPSDGSIGPGRYNLRPRTSRPNYKV
ncbi:uncharacterized protein LOC129927331 [Biomphalaria glabrata]|uniref:RNA-directed DNA polymerase n=1 Tax=Biomphalaria glabrata TaxID=6526 RepID=A0A9W3AX79_BIOGL|nr:uncharacterized protein LOC129927331 [Biomphalaria glabrata]